MLPPLPSSPTATPADKPLVLMTWADLQATMQQTLIQALQLHQQQVEADRRLTTDEAAKFLGVRPEYVQRLHKRGLPYEKGRPNRYRLADLQAYQEKQRLHHRPAL